MYKQMVDIPTTFIDLSKWQFFAKGGFGTIFKNGNVVVKTYHNAQYFEYTGKTRTEAIHLEQTAMECLDNEIKIILHIQTTRKHNANLFSVLICEYFANFGSAVKMCPVFKLGKDFINHYHEDISPFVNSHPDVVKAMLIQIIYCLLNGLYAIHACGIFHRDIKPDNLLFFPSKMGLERYKICDFGLSSFLSNNGKDTGIRGTVGYFPPELEQDTKYYRGDLVDVWAAGTTINAIINSTKIKDLILAPDIYAMCRYNPSKRPTSENLFTSHIIQKQPIFMY